MVRVCFVCLGNICRSPTAEAAFRRLVREAGLEAEFLIDSAGTGDWHVGQRSDPRSIAAGRRRGLELNGRARQFQPEDFERFDYVLAMDRSNYDDLRAMTSPEVADRKLHLARSFDPSSPPGASVPDPYLGHGGFEEVIDLCLAASQGLLEHLRERHGIGR
jgi:protein-tyrosine phosphatase